MNPPPDSPFDALQQIVQANQALIENFLRDLPASGAGNPGGLMQALVRGGPAQMDKLRALQERFYRRQLALWQQVLGGAADAIPGADTTGDHRFDAPEWRDLPFFRYLLQAYRLNTRFLTELGEIADLDPQARRRLQYLLRQFADAIAPTNFAATNPEVIRLAAASQGESLAQGLKLLAADLARGRISMSDEAAFEVGRNLAVTPGSVVLENTVMQLIQYAPTTAQVHARPLLIVPPFINKYYILDLQPQNSFVRFCTEQGFTTFIVSWRNIPPELGQLGWDDYIEHGVLAPIEAARSITGAEKVNALGFCVGGTLLATALAVLAGRKLEPVASMTLLASLLDFSETGDISVYIDADFVDRVEQEYRNGGVMPGSRLAATFAALRANDLVWHFVINNYLKGREPKAFDLLYWNADSSNLPGRLYAWYLRNMYHENNLRNPGKLNLCDVPVDLGAVRIPAYLMAAREDHIVPWQSAYLGIGLLGGECEFVLAASGHVAGVVNPAAGGRRHFWSQTATPPSPEAWLENARQHPGSWWPHWAAWLRSQAGATRPAPRVAGNPVYPVIEPAPGRYVKEKIG